MIVHKCWRSDSRIKGARLDLIWNLFRISLNGHQPGSTGAQQPECTQVHEDSEHRTGPDRARFAKP